LEKDLDQELSDSLKDKWKLEQEELQVMRNQKILDKFKSKMNEHKRYAENRIAYFKKWIAYFTWRMNGGRQRWKFSKEWFQHKIDRSTKMKEYFEGEITILDDEIWKAENDLLIDNMSLSISEDSLYLEDSDHQEDNINGNTNKNLRF